MFNVYAYSSFRVKQPIVSFDTESEALEFCVDYEWEWMDSNNFVWNLDYEEDK